MKVLASPGEARLAAHTPRYGPIQEGGVPIPEGGPVYNKHNLSLSTWRYSSRLPPSGVKSVSSPVALRWVCLTKRTLTLLGQSQIRYSLAPPGFSESGIH